MNDFDVVVVGGGIAGLWTLTALRHAGYNATLFEKDTLGGQQTLASQGIIHGGTKYALTGKLTGSSESVRSMPVRWKAHLAGEKYPDLSAVHVNTQHQWMWDAGGISSRILNFFASKVMSSRVKSVESSHLPEFLNGHQVYQLDEPVLDVRSVVQSLADANSGSIFRVEVKSTENHSEGVVVKAVSADNELSVNAGCVIFAAGEGSETIQKVSMQRRPLQMVMVKGELPALCGHIIEANANPRLTITSHHVSDQQVVWYLGGQLAEDGVNMSSADLISKARVELKQLLPAVSWQNMQWATFSVNRAEGAQPGGKRPDEPVIRQRGRSITVWPTKLVFAPMVADQVTEMVDEMGLDKRSEKNSEHHLPGAEIGLYPWDTVEWVG